jgi:hypothetical protein
MCQLYEFLWTYDMKALSNILADSNVAASLKSGIVLKAWRQIKRRAYQKLMLYTPSADKQTWLNHAFINARINFNFLTEGLALLTQEL